MIYNYTKCESVIAKIMADLDSNEVKLRTSDIKEWIFEAVEKIGAPMQYIKRESGVDGAPLLKIEDNQVPIPSDMVALDGIAYSESKNGPWVPVNLSTAVFSSPNREKGHDNDDRPINYKMFTSQSQFYTINGVKCAEKLFRNIGNLPEYFIKPGWIVINRSKGFIKLSYKSIAVDERGYPLIPDNPSYQEAIYWYVTMKLSFPKYMSGKLGGKGVNSATNVYFYIQQQWNFFRNQAYAEAMMPNADGIENIKNEWNKLLPELDARDTFFKDIGKQQSIYTDYYYGY